MAKKVFYALIVSPVIYIFSSLPFFLLYTVSDVLYFLIYNVIRYRRSVVIENLTKSFPGKSKTELKKIEKDYYRFLCDLILESLKTLTISKQDVLNRCKMRPQAKAIFDELALKNKSCLIVMGHFGNWEWGGSVSGLICKQPLQVVYHPIRTVFFDELMKKIRTRFGNTLCPMKDTLRLMLKNKNKLNATVLIADQTPAPESAYWTKFLHQDTPFFLGTEKIARKLNLPIVYARIVRIERGYYEISAELICEFPNSLNEGEITQLHVAKLEEDILKFPHTWLWSHRRWKHRRPSDNFIPGQYGL